MSLNEFPKFDASHTNLELSTQFYQLLTDSSNYVLKRIQVLPQKVMDENPEIQQILNETGSKIAFVNDDLTGYQEVVLSDKIMSKMFIECYSALYLKSTPSDQVLIPAIVILMITPNDTTAIKKLWLIICQCNSKSQVLLIFFVLGGYLSSNYDKTNKSSCLWTLFKKLLIRIKNNGFFYRSGINLKKNLNQWKNQLSDDDLLYYSIEVCLRSVSEHPRNYYATASLRFLLSRYKEESIEQLHCELIKQIAIMKYDLSLWKVICGWLLDGAQNSIDHYREEAVRFSGKPVRRSKMKKIHTQLAEIIVRHGTTELFAYLMTLLGDEKLVISGFRDAGIEIQREIIRRLLINDIM